MADMKSIVAKSDNMSDKSREPSSLGIHECLKCFVVRFSRTDQVPECLRDPSLEPTQNHRSVWLGTGVSCGPLLELVQSVREHPFWNRFGAHRNIQPVTGVSGIEVSSTWLECSGILFLVVLIADHI